MRFLATTAAALLALCASAYADGAAPTVVQPAAPQPVAVQAAPPAPQKKVKLICRAVFHEGMLLRGNDCRTQEEWDIMRRDAERQISNFQNHSYTQ
jgi:hypothetical protein